jgi:molybdopterin molybdotransferase
VVGDIPAGQPSSAVLKSGQAMRIMTGAPIPAGADAVIPVEDTDADGRGTDAPLLDHVQIRRAVQAGAYVRVQAEDYRAGDLLVPPGRRVRPQEAALLAMQGQARVLVYRKPRVALFSSGDELAAPDEALKPGQIRETNSFSLAAQVESCGAERLALGIAPDRLDAIVATLDKAVEMGAELILSSAGVSVGAYDYLREALLSAGKLDFWRVNMRPGKPLAFGSYRGVPYIGLPGNPVSAFVGFEVFVRPALHKMGGVDDWSRLRVAARLVEDLHSDGRESYLRGVLRGFGEEAEVDLTGHQGSGNLYSLAQANCLIRVPAEASSIKAGDQVEAWPL